VDYRCRLELRLWRVARRSMVISRRRGSPAAAAGMSSFAILSRLTTSLPCRRKQLSYKTNHRKRNPITLSRRQPHCMQCALSLSVCVSVTVSVFACLNAFLRLRHVMFTSLFLSSSLCMSSLLISAATVCRYTLCLKKQDAWLLTNFGKCRPIFKKKSFSDKFSRKR